MSTQLKLRRGTTAQHSTFTGAEGEITVDTTKDTVVVHDGSTAGGIPLAKESALSSLATDSTVVHKTGDETVAGTKTLSSNPVLSSGTANGVAYLNGSKVLTTGSALTFDGANLGVNTSSPILTLDVKPATNVHLGVGTGQIESSGVILNAYNDGASANIPMEFKGTNFKWIVGSEQMRLTSTGLGIGTSSPQFKLNSVQGAAGAAPSVTSAIQVYAKGYGGSAQQYAGIGFAMHEHTNGYWGSGILARDDSGSYGAALSFYVSTGSATPTPTEAMRLSSSGNLGLGVTPSAWGASQKAIQINTRAALASNGGNTSLGYNWYNSGSANVYVASAAASLYEQSAGTHAWYTAPSGTAGNAISFTQAMTLDASGNLLVGTTTGDGSRLRVYGAYQTLGDGAYEGIIGKASSIVSGGGTGDFAIRSAANIVFASNGNTERMRIDSSGNVGIGTSSPTAPLDSVSNASAIGLRIRGRSSDNFSLINFVGNNPVNDYAYIGAPTANTLAFYTNGFTERMRIDSSGNVGIGTSSPGAKLEASGASTNDLIKLTRTGSSAGSGFIYANSAEMFGVHDGTRYPFQIKQLAPTGSLTIDSSGNVLVGTTSVGGVGLTNALQSSNGILSIWNTNYALGFITQQFRYNGTAVGSIVINTTSTSFNTSSDYRLKENIQPMQNALGVVAQLNPVTYTWKADGSDGQGFIAHELQAVVPDCVTGEKDAVDAEGKPVYQGVDTSFLVATLTKAIQEQQELINQLTARVAQLEGN